MKPAFRHHRIVFMKYPRDLSVIKKENTNAAAPTLQFVLMVDYIYLGKWTVQPCSAGTFCVPQPEPQGMACLSLNQISNPPRICPKVAIEESSDYGITSAPKCSAVTDGTACDPLEQAEVCSSSNTYGQCIQTPQKRWLMRFMKRSQDTSLVGKWLVRDCPAGTVCVIKSGKVECQDERFVASDCSQ
eukprot:NODE_25_length_41203_cov_0.917113.p16 type:complete len:187 gc:universal NODE_25_length_41203_cov_0.917113:5112-4552(-)